VNDERPPRRAKTATERDLEGLRAREERARTHAPALGVPIVGTNPHDDFTPVGDVLDQIVDPDARRVVALLWRHTANIELRARQRLDESDAGALRRDLNILCDDLGDLRTAIVDIQGTSGNDGKLGEITREVRGWSSRRWWLLTFVAAALLSGLAGMLYVGYLPTATPSLGASYELHAVAAAVLGGCSLQGGKGSVFGVVIGAGILQITFNAVNLIGQSLWQNVVAGGVILAAVIIDQLIENRRALAGPRRPAAAPTPAVAEGRTS